MSLRELWARLMSVLRKKRLDEELADEIDAHLEQAERDFREQGMTADAARRAARRSFGGVEPMKGQYRDRRSVPWLETLLRDLRYSARTLARSPGFAAVAVVSLALGIGANTAIFTLLDQVLLRALPVERPHELALFDSPGPNPGMVRRTGSLSFSHPLFRDLQEQLDSFSGVLAQFPLPLTLSDRGAVEQIEGALVSGNYFEVLGLRPVLGRLLTPADDRQREAHPVAVLSYDFWRRRFGADPAVVGRGIALQGQAMTVVGVAPAGFRGLEVGSAVDVMVPLMMMEPMTPTWDGLEDRRASWLNIYGRLKPGVTREQAEARSNVVYRRLLAQEEREMQRVTEAVRGRFLARRLELLPGGQGPPGFRAYFSTPLLILAAGVGIVLLIACANLAALLTVRMAKRQREIAIRRAIGAGRGQVVRQALVESLTLSVTGASLGLALAYAANQAVLQWLPVDGVTRSISAGPDVRVLGFSIVLSLGAALLFGLGPAMLATRANVVQGLKAEAGGTVARGTTRFRGFLVGAQVALAVVLLTAAGAFVSSLGNLKSVDLGFQPDRLMSFDIDPVALGFPRDRSPSLAARLHRELRETPGVQSASFAVSGPLNITNTMTIRIGGFDAEETSVSTDWVGPDYFSTVGLPIVAGREITDTDHPESRKVAVINSAMAERFFGNRNPVGQTVYFAYDRRRRPIEIVGVVGDSKLRAVKEDNEPCLYVAYMQNSNSPVRFLVNTGLPAEAVPKALEEPLASVFGVSPLVRLEPVDVQVDEALFVERALASASAGFGSLALFLAGIGLYGVVSYTAAQRTRELGIRSALGASRTRLIAPVLRDVGRTTVIGALIGLAVALPLGRLIEAQLYEVSATEPALLCAAAAVVLIAAAAACAAPALRATRVDPATTLRFD